MYLELISVFQIEKRLKHSIFVRTLIKAAAVNKYRVNTQIVNHFIVTVLMN
jgi:hypothetical protein